MSLHGLAGDHEPFQDTVRRLLYDEKEHGLDHVAYISEGGVNDGVRTVTGTVAAHADVLAASDANTYFRLQWRVLGEIGNDWIVQMRKRPVARITVSAGANRVRIDFTDGQTMDDVLADIYASTELQAVVSVAALHGAHLADQEPAVAMYSFAGGAQDVVDRNIDLTPSDMRYFEKESNVFVKVSDDDSVEVSAGNTSTWNMQTVRIDVYGKHAHSAAIRRQLVQVKEDISRIIYERQNPPYLKTTDDRRSAIMGFDSYELSWEHLEADGERGITEQWSTELGVYYQRDRVAVE